MGSDAQLTPMMAQYRRIKGELPGDALLLFRLGDFYEMFFEDAHTGAQLFQCRAHQTRRVQATAHGSRQNRFGWPEDRLAGTWTGAQTKG